jgi:hypothetical protein
MMESAVANPCSIPFVEQTVVSDYGSPLRRCYGTDLPLQFLGRSAVGGLLRKGGFNPSWNSTVVVLFLRGPQLLQQCRSDSGVAPSFLANQI